MSKSIKIGSRTFTGVEKISCACAIETGTQREFIDKDDAATAEAVALADGSYQINITGGIITNVDDE